MQSMINRVLVVVLLVAIIAVLAVGFLKGRQDQASVSQSPIDIAAALGHFYMPAEFEPQELLFLSGEELVVNDPQTMITIARALRGEVQVEILVGSAAGKSAVDSLLGAAGLASPAARPLRLPVQSMWLRDFGPLTVTDVDGRRSMVEFRCGPRQASPQDNRLSAKLAVLLDLAILSNQLQVDGGDLLSNGRGMGIMSARVVAGNAGYREKESEEIPHTVAAMLGFEKVVTVPALRGEPSGHVDMFCAFLAADLLVVGSYEVGVDAENSAQLDQLAKEMAGLPTLAGPLRVVRISLPNHTDGIWRSYTNVIMANGVVLVPIYPNYCPDLDAWALAFYRQHYPERNIVGVDASILARQGGGLRGVTMNVPVGASLN